MQVRRAWRRVSGGRGRWVVLAATILAVGIPAFAAANNGDVARMGQRNFATRETRLIANTTGYATRQSNAARGAGGSAIYGCRSDARHQPCVYAANLLSGKAFEFSAKQGVAGRIAVGSGGDNAKPFTTNATGVADGLNADRVDGRNASDFEAAANHAVIAPTRLAKGQTATLLTAGPLSLTGVCLPDPAIDVAQVLVSTTVAGAAFSGEDSSANLTPQTDAGARRLAQQQQQKGTAGFSSRSGAVAIAPDGTTLTAQLYTGVNTLGAGCVVGGTVELHGPGAAARG